MVDTLALGASAARRGGSSPLSRTIKKASGKAWGFFNGLDLEEMQSLVSERSERELVEPNRAQVLETSGLAEKGETR